MYSDEEESLIFGASRSVKKNFRLILNSAQILIFPPVWEHCWESQVSWRDVTILTLFWNRCFLRVLYILSSVLMMIDFYVFFNKPRDAV